MIRLQYHVQDKVYLMDHLLPRYSNNNEIPVIPRRGCTAI